ncbi:hypothetical protein DL768_011621 [Monosporascus sp. mg162]|nr:hypothetical protein DL768_011621 [Monosporascus sp. mg162]
MDALQIEKEGKLAKLCKLVRKNTEFNVPLFAGPLTGALAEQPTEPVFDIDAAAAAAAAAVAVLAVLAAAARRFSFFMAPAVVANLPALTVAAVAGRRQGAPFPSPFRIGRGYRRGQKRRAAAEA